MNKNLIALAAVTVAALGLQAQDTQAIQAPAAQTESSGLIGKRYAAADFSYFDFKGLSNDVYGSSIRVNAPVTANLDSHASYQYVWMTGSGSNEVHYGDVGFTAYMDQGKIKPFLKADLGYVWPDSDDRFVWDTAVGAELQLCAKASAFASVGYSDDFKGDNGDMGSFQGKLGLTFWVNEKIALTAVVTAEEAGDYGYSLGAAYRF